LTPAERNDYVISGGTGLHWAALDEDILVSALLLGNRDQSSDAWHEAFAVRDRKAGEWAKGREKRGGEAKGGREGAGESRKSGRVTQ